MILVHFSENGYIVDGHALFAKHGEDIVCAGVSALTQSALFGSLVYTNLVTYVQESGYLSVHLKEQTPETKGILTAMKLGIKAIARQYPNHITITEEEKGNEERI